MHCVYEICTIYKLYTKSYPGLELSDHIGRKTLRNTKIQGSFQRNITFYLSVILIFCKVIADLFKSIVLNYTKSVTNFEIKIVLEKAILESLRILNQILLSRIECHDDVPSILSFSTTL